MIHIHLPDDTATSQLGEIVFAWLCDVVTASDGGISVFLRGPLGAGKSALTRAVLRAAGVESNIPSPTYSLVEHYPLSTAMQFFHVDAYRLSNSDELDYLGADEWSGPGVVLMVEWPDRVLSALAPPQLEVTLDYCSHEQSMDEGSKQKVNQVHSGADRKAGAAPGAPAAADGMGRVVTLSAADAASESALEALLRKGAFIPMSPNDLDAAQSSRSVI